MLFVLVTWSMKESLVESVLQFPVLSWQMPRESWRGEKTRRKKSDQLNLVFRWVYGRFVLKTQPSAWSLCHTAKQHSLICTVSKDIIVLVVMFLKKMQERKENVWCEAHLFIFPPQFWGVTLQAILLNFIPSQLCLRMGLWAVGGWGLIHTQRRISDDGHVAHSQSICIWLGQETDSLKLHESTCSRPTVWGH